MPKKTVKLIIDGENDYIITIKGNQANLLKTVTELAESSIAIGANVHYERLHGRSTAREVKVYLIPPNILSDWVGALDRIDWGVLYLEKTLKAIYIAFNV